MPQNGELGGRNMEGTRNRGREEIEKGREKKRER